MESNRKYYISELTGEGGIRTRALNSITGKGQLDDKDKLIKWEIAGEGKNRKGKGSVGAGEGQGSWSVIHLASHPFTQQVLI